MIVGLGNPGSKYANTRHNVGFMIVDELGRRFGADTWKLKDDARQALLRARDLVLVQPQSFMNDSGIPTRLVAAWYRIPADRILVVYDDLDLPFGTLRMRARGSSGGHNGIKSLIRYFEQEFPRLKVGIGRGRDGNAIGQVLGEFSAAERGDLPTIVSAGADACERWLSAGFTAAANIANAWQLDPLEPAPPPSDDGNKPGKGGVST